jgi:YbbR domain-containing protein
MAIIKLSATERRRVSAFFTCLMLAILAWVFSVLSNPYKYRVKAALVFKNAPQKRAFHSLQPDTIDITLAGSGWEMLFSKMNYKNKVIAVDLSPLKTKNFVVLSSQLTQINNKKEISQQIADFSPDTLYFDFTNRQVKRVPVNLVTAIRYQHQFSQSGNAHIQPEYVTVSGPENMVDKISAWNSDTLNLDSINETVNTGLNLRPVSEGGMSVYPKTVRVTIPVDEFTEKTLLVPVNLINNKNETVKIFPQKVKITFTIPLGKYAETDEDSFVASANFDLWRLRNYKVLPVMLSKIPSYCKIVKIEPRDIDFIIMK